MWLSWPRSFWRWWLLVLLAASLLRFWQLPDAKLWYDEISTAWMASLPFPRMLAATAGDVHPPLYYALEWAALRLAGPSPLALRLPSALLSLAGLIALLPLAKQLQLSPTATLAATTIMAVSSWQLHYAQEARMYALLQLEVLIALSAVLARSWWPAGLAVAALLYTHNYGALYAAVLGLLALRDWRLGPRALAAPVAAFGLAGLAYAPWAGLVTWQQLAAVKGLWWTEPTTLGAALQPFYAFLFREVGWAFGAQLQVVVFGLLALAALRMLQQRPAAALPLALMALGPLALALLAEVVYRPILLDRALTGSAPAVYLTLGWLLADGLRPAWRKWGWAVLGPLLALGAVFYHPSNVIFKALNTPDLARYITPQPGDLVYHVNMASALYVHAEAPGLTPQAVAAPWPLDRGGLTLATVEALGIPVVELDQLRWQRAWLVWVATPNQSREQDAWVAATLARHPHEQVYALDVALADGLMDGGIWLLQR